MNSKRFFDWCRTAVGKIWYKPDRDEVHAELYAHMLDRYDGLLEKGCSPEEAERRTLRAMGDPLEISLQLQRTYRSFWPKFLFFTRILAFLLFVVSLFVSWEVYQEIIPVEVNHVSKERWGQEYIQAAEIYMEPDVSATCEGYTYTISKVKLDRGILSAQLQVSNFQMWLGEPGAVAFFWAVDSQGNYYYNDTRVYRGIDILGEGMRTGLFTHTYELDLYLLDEELETVDAQWVELHYDRSGRDIVLRIDLMGVSTT